MKFIKNLFKKLDKKEYTDVKVDLSNILSNEIKVEEILDKKYKVKKIKIFNIIYREYYVLYIEDKFILPNEEIKFHSYRLVKWINFITSYIFLDTIIGVNNDINDFIISSKKIKCYKKLDIEDINEELTIKEYLKKYKKLNYFNFIKSI